MSKILYIDAGHGGLDAAGNYTTPPRIGKYYDHLTKAKFHKNGIFYEGVWNRSFAAKFIELATAAGFQCVPVYHPVNDTRLGDRVDLANKHWEKHGKEGVYLSFHSNAANGQARGFHLFFHPESKKGKAIAQSILPAVNKVFTDRGSSAKFPLREGYMDADKKAIYYVLQATSMPSLLFEFGFFDNLEDAKMIFEEQFQCDLAIELVKALEKAKLY